MIIVLPKNTLTDAEKEDILVKGHTVIECKDPNKVKVINPELNIDPNECFMAALSALTVNMPTSKAEHFVNNLYQGLLKKGESTKS